MRRRRRRRPRRRRTGRAPACVRVGAPARAPRVARRLRGRLRRGGLLLQLGGGRGGGGASGGRGAGCDPRLGRPPRQWDAGDLLRGAAVALLAAPNPWFGARRPSFFDRTHVCCTPRCTPTSTQAPARPPRPGQPTPPPRGETSTWCGQTRRDTPPPPTATTAPRWTCCCCRSCALSTRVSWWSPLALTPPPVSRSSSRLSSIDRTCT
mmetsp:Transcript_23241/g.74400  ORF Transcript_23241/g.74400 Transcript_23241/m.74400 type:complete len:208 (+) Transcript_23241:883-1506(+)